MRFSYCNRAAATDEDSDGDDDAARSEGGFLDGGGGGGRFFKRRSAGEISADDMEGTRRVYSFSVSDNDVSEPKNDRGDAAVDI